MKNETLRNQDRMPHITLKDENFYCRQDAQLYGDLITREEVVRITDILVGIKRQDGPFDGCKVGANVRKWRESGFKEALSSVEATILAAYYEAGKVFAGLSTQFSPSGAAYYCYSRLMNLREAIDAGIWTEEGVEEFKTAKQHIAEVLEATVPSEYLTVKDVVEKLKTLDVVCGPREVKRNLDTLVDEAVAVGGNFAGVMHYGPADR